MTFQEEHSFINSYIFPRASSSNKGIIMIHIFAGNGEAAAKP